uniref:Uncharacterized protein n=1 Tax=Anguilla anguilla TaxID=7936 RepID=A0A0E9XPE4_ANGAN
MCDGEESSLIVPLQSASELLYKLCVTAAFQHHGCSS